MKLENYFIAGNMAWGEVYNDGKGRFADGTHIRTSLIQEIYEEDGKTFAKTMNSVYELGTKAGEQDV